MENERSSAALGMTSPIAKLGIVGLGASPAPLDIAVNVALPAITDHFALALSDVQWLVVCYVLVYGSLMLVCGKMGDLVGHRLIFRTGLVVTAVGCVACGASRSRRPTKSRASSRQRLPSVRRWKGSTPTPTKFPTKSVSVLTRSTKRSPTSRFGRFVLKLTKSPAPACS